MLYILLKYKFTIFSTDINLLLIHSLENKYIFFLVHIKKDFSFKKEPISTSVA